MSKKFFYVCAGLFLLALSYHLGARSATAQAGVQQSGTMQRQAWEYKTLVYTIEFNGVGSLIEDGKPAAGSPVSKAPQLGAAGWELAGFTAVSSSHTDAVTGSVTSTPMFVYWFKRPL